jgi:hypothetical protein
LGAAFLAIGLAGVAVGYFLGRSSHATAGGQSGRRGAGVREAGADGAGVGPGAPGGTAGSAGRAAGRGAAPSRAGAAVIDLSGLPPGEAWRRLIEITDPVVRVEAVRKLLASMTPDQWPGWLAKMVESFEGEEIDDDDPGVMAGLFSTLDALLGEMASTHPREAITAMLSMKEGHDMVVALMSNWARRDLTAARAFFESELAGQDFGKNDDIAKSLVREMGKTDPKGALEWAGAQANGDVRASGLLTAFEAVLRHDRNEAIALLGSRTDLPRREELAERIATEWSKSDPAQAFAWSQSLSDDLRRGALQRAFDAWLQEDPAAARQGFESTDPERRAALLPSLVSRTPGDQIGELADVLSAQPPSEGRAEASRVLMRQWVEQDSIAATSWLAHQPPGEMQDHAIIGFLSWADGNEPEAALEWAGTITNPDMRNRQIEELVERYRRERPDLALEWVNSTTHLTPQEREHLLGTMAR